MDSTKESNLTVPSYSCSDWSNLSIDSVTVEYWDVDSEPEKTHAAITAAFTLLFLAAGLPSNLLIVTAIVRLRLFKEPTYILLLNLTVSNVLTCVLVMPFTIVAGFAGGFKFGGSDVVRCAFCQFQLVYSIFTTFSFHILVLLALDRFIFIKYPFQYHQWITRWRTTCIVLVLWAFCTLLALLPLFGIGNFEFRYHIASCNLQLAAGWMLSKNIYYTIALLVESAILLVVLIGSNVWIVCIVQRHLYRMYSSKNSQWMKDVKERLDGAKSKKQLQLVKVFVSTFVAHSVTWLPVMIRIIGTAVSGSDEFFPGWFYVFVSLSLVSYTIVHPLILIATIPDIRTSIGTLLCCCSHCSKSCQTNCHFSCTCKSMNKCLDLVSFALLPVQDEISV